jgi:hypothetical protein
MAKLRNVGGRADSLVPFNLWVDVDWLDTYPEELLAEIDNERSEYLKRTAVRPWG